MIISRSQKFRIAIFFVVYNHKNAISFKADLRILIDFDEEEFNLVYSEVCLSDTRKLMKLVEAKKKKKLNKKVVEEFTSVDRASPLNDSAITDDTRAPDLKKFLIKKQLY